MPGAPGPPTAPGIIERPDNGAAVGPPHCTLLTLIPRLTLGGGSWRGRVGTATTHQCNGPCPAAEAHQQNLQTRQAELVCQPHARLGLASHQCLAASEVKADRPPFRHARAAYSCPIISAISSVSTAAVWYQEWPQLAHLSERPCLTQQLRWNLEMSRTVRAGYPHYASCCTTARFLYYTLSC